MPTLYQQALNNFVASSVADDVKLKFLELAELSAKCRDDVPLFFAEMLGIPCNEFQEKFLSRSTTPRKDWMAKWGEEVEQIGGLIFGKNIAFPSNQIGKTVMIAGKHIHRNFYKIGLDIDETLIDKAHYSTLNISPHSRQVKQAYQYVKDILNEQFLITDEDGRQHTNKLNPLLKDFLAGENATLGELRFRNKSVFYTVPTGADQAAWLAGAQFGYISYDECAQSLHLESELGAKILSRLIRYGTGLDLISTPEVDSPSHQYYLHIVKMGQRGEDGWWSLGGHLDQNRFIKREQREMAKAELLKTDKNKYRQVVKGEFISGGKRFFDANEIENMWKLKAKQVCIPGHKYLIISDWGMSDTGDDSVHGALDYTDYANLGKIKLVNHEEMKGGSPHMQFALLRSLYDAYTYVLEGADLPVKPIFVMDAKALGGVTIKKLLANLNPKAFEIEKDDALLILKKEMSAGRDYYESEVDASIIEKNPDYGNIESYYIEKLADQLGIYHIKDEKLKQDFVMMLMMGVAWIVKKVPRAGKPATLDPLAGYNAGIRRTTAQRRQVGLGEMLHKK